MAEPQHAHVRAPAPDGRWGEVLGYVLITLVSGLLALMIVRKLQEHSRSRREFADLCGQRGLSPEEQDLLRLLARLSASSTPT